MPTRKVAPEDRIHPLKMGAYGAGGLANNLLAAGSGGMMIALNLGYGMNPALVGLLGALPRLTDAITDPVMGHVSDRTRSRWGRRRPYIFVGAILAPLILALLWQLPEGRSESFYFNYFLIGSFVFFLAYTVFATPWVALGYELTPDYNERTRLMGVQNFVAQIAWVVAPWFLLVMELPVFGDMRQGAAALAIGLALTCAALGVLPALVLRERQAGAANPWATNLATRPPMPWSPRSRRSGLSSSASSSDPGLAGFPEALRGDVSRVQRLPAGGVLPGLRDHLLRVRRRSGRRRLLGGLDRHCFRHRHVRGHPPDYPTRHPDRQTRRILRVHRHLDVRIRSQMVLLRPGQSLVAASSRSASSRSDWEACSRSWAP